MRWHEQHGLRAKRRSSVSRLAISPSFSLLSLLPLSSLQDDPSLSPPPRLSFCPSSRVAVFHFSTTPTPHILLHVEPQQFSPWFLVHGKGCFLTVKVQTVRCPLCKERQRVQNLQGFVRHHSVLEKNTHTYTHKLRGTRRRLQICFCRHLQRLLPLSSDQLGFIIFLRCQDKLVGLNELLQPTATILGDRKSDKISPYHLWASY